MFDLVYRNLCDKISNYCPYQRMGGRLFEGRLIDNLVSRVGAYLRVGAYSRGALNQSITVYMFYQHNAYSIIMLRKAIRQAYTNPDF